MVTLGVDLASQAKRTAVCLIRWDGESARVDMLDALVAALVARAAAVGCCEPIADADGRLARQEGWIALPQSDSLARLATIRPDSLTRIV